MTQQEQSLICEWLGIAKILPKCECPLHGCCVCYRNAVYPELLNWDGYGLMIEAMKAKNIQFDIRSWSANEN